MNWQLLNDYWFLQLQEKIHPIRLQNMEVHCVTSRYAAWEKELWDLSKFRARSFKSMKASYLDDVIPMNFPFIGFSMWNFVIIPPLLDESS